MPTKLIETGIEFPDTTVQTTKAVAAVPQSQVFTAPGTFSIPPSTTRVKVTVVGGSGGAPGPAAGASGGTTSFGAYASATGGSATAPGNSPGSQLNAPIQEIGKFGATVDTSRFGGYGVTTIDAPFPVTSVPVTIGAGGGGGGNDGVGQGINGGSGPFAQPGDPRVQGIARGVGGGGAGGLTAPFQGAGGPAFGAGQPGAGPFATRFGGGAGGTGGTVANPSGEGDLPRPPGGTGGFQGVVIVEY